MYKKHFLHVFILSIFGPLPELLSIIRLNELYLACFYLPLLLNVTTNLTQMMGVKCSHL